MLFGSASVLFGFASARLRFCSGSLRLGSGSVMVRVGAASALFGFASEAKQSTLADTDPVTTKIKTDVNVLTSYWCKFRGLTDSKIASLRQNLIFLIFSGSDTPTFLIFFLGFRGLKTEGVIVPKHKAS